MLIVCPNCATSYDVQPASLEPQGRQVRCVRCRTVWRAQPSRAAKLVAAAAALAPESIADQSPQAEAAHAHWAAVGADPRLGAEPGDDLPGPPPDVVAGAWSVDASLAQSEDFTVEAPPIAPAGRDIGHEVADEADDHAADGADGFGPDDDGDHDREDTDLGHEAVAPADIARFIPRRFRRGENRLSWSLSTMQTLVLVLLVVDAVVIGWRKDIVRLLPQTETFYAALGLPVNLRGLTFDGVSVGTEMHDGIPILVVQGNIVNDTPTIVNVPRLKLVLRNAARQEIYSWTAAPPRPRLSPFEAVGFRTRLASPPAASSGVLVRFLSRRDLVAEPR